MRCRSLFLLLSIQVFSSVLVFGQASKQELNDQFFEAVRKGELANVTALLDKGVDVNAKFRYGMTALFKAAERGHVDIVKLLLARGADITVKDTFYGATAMSWALQNNHVEVVGAFLEKDATTVNDVLITGVGEGKPEFVKLALAKGGMSKEIMTRALAIALADKDTAAIAEVLKKAGAVPPPEIKPETLQSYVGKYKSDAGMEITFSFANGAFTGVRTGQRPQRLYAIDDVTFAPMFAEDILVHFEVEGGKVAGMTLTEAKKTTKLARLN